MTFPESVGRQQATVEIRHLRQLEECADVVKLLCKVWATDSAEDLVNISLLRSWAMSGNYVVGAYLEGVLVGAAVAFRGEHHVHSHIVGVQRTLQGRYVGYQLKEHQRRWALAQGFRAIRWTFDPLIRRNAFFNLAKLGGRVLAYHENFYGSLKDGINDGDASDRLLVEWTITTAEIGPERREYVGTDVPEIAKFHGYEDEDWEAAGPVATTSSPEGEVRLVATPKDIEAWRHARVDRAAFWRSEVRQAFLKALNDGFMVTGFTAGGLYLLEPRR